MKMKIDEKTCDGSPFCPANRVCPRGALTRMPSGRWRIESERCSGCGVCSRVCPTGAVQIDG